MKKSFFASAIIIFTLIFFTNCQNNNMKRILQIIEQTKTEYASDKRVAIFNINAEEKEDKILLNGETNLSFAVDSLLKKLKSNEINFVDNIDRLPNKNVGSKKFGIVNISVANIRSKPSHPAELATQSLLGTCVNVLKIEGSWYLIQTPDKYISWVDDDGVHLVDENEMDEWKNSSKVIITEQFTTAYYGRSNKSRNISDLVAGNILKIVEQNGNYTKVEFPDGRAGYVKSDHLQDYDNWNANSEANEKTILETASIFMGLPYLWGGTSTKAVDCSGFTKTVFYMNGVILPRDASQQVHVGELVNTYENFDNLQKGDLLFFGSKASENKKEKITHVAIYIGDYKYIHSAGKVKINSFKKDEEDFNKYRLDTFIRARRIIGDYCTGENLVKNNSFYN